MSYTLTVECRFAASHILPGCPPCDTLHGHTWTVRASWAFTQLDAAGMGMNFRALKEALRSEIHARYDHTHLNDTGPFDEIAPTAENLARAFYLQLKHGLDTGDHGRLEKVEVWESPEACAAYGE